MTKLTEHIQLLYNTIINKQLYRDLLPSQHKWKEVGNNLITNCPFPDHEDKNPSFSISKTKPVYICSCGRSGNWLKLTADVENLSSRPLTGETFRTVLKRLEQIAGIPSMDLDPTTTARQVAAIREQDILNATAAFFQQCLLKDIDTQSYLINERGFKREEIEKTRLGSFPGGQETLDYLCDLGYKTYEIYQESPKAGMNPSGALCWLYSFPRHRLAIPFYDVTGTRVVGIKLRTIQPPKQGEAKYPPLTYMSNGFKKKCLYNIDLAKGKEILLVEGLLDAAILTANGYPAAALDGCNLYADQIILAIKNGAVNFILCLDNDKAGKNGAQKAIVEIAKHFPSKHVYVANLPIDIKDPNELIVKRGIEEFKSIIDQREPAGKWIMREVIKTLPKDFDLYNVFDQSKEILADISPIDFDYALSELAHFYPVDGIRKEFENYRLQEQKKWKAKEFYDKTESLLGEAHKTLIQEGAAKALGYVEERIYKIKDQSIEQNQGLSFRDRLQNIFNKDDQRIPDDLLGYKLNKFRQMACDIDGIQAGLYLLAGETHIGKTAYLNNLFLDAILTNPALCGIYYSLDDNERYIVGRLLSILAEGGITINETRRIPTNPSKKNALNNARNLIKNLAQAGRLEIKDFSLIQSIDDIERDIKSRDREIETLIVIDGLQNIEVEKLHTGLRDINIERANKLKQIVDVYYIPIITSVEVRKKAQNKSPNEMPEISDIMETGKFAYNASLIWIIHPADYQEFFNNNNNKQIVNLKIAKNKLSDFKGNRELEFLKSTGIMKEKHHSFSGIPVPK